MIRIIDVRKDGKAGLYEMLSSRNGAVRARVAGAAEEIIASVRKDGDNALVEFARRFDGVEPSAYSIKVDKKEIDAACSEISGELLGVIRKAKRNIEAFHEKQKENSWFTTGADGTLLGQLYRPLDTAGIYVPGGTAPLPSSVLMNAIPARVAGVKKVIMATPPRRDGSVSPAILAAAREAGVDEVYRVGGAQAIAAMAFGTETVPKADKITGPGNIYVAAAKRLVFGYCDIDMVAGPSEIAIVADSSANPAFIAADLLSQAEHDPLASAILVTDSETLAGRVRGELEKQLSSLVRHEIAERSIIDYGAVVIVSSIGEAVEMINNIAPEHLELCVGEPFGLLGSVRNAGAVFLGSYSPEPLGDYFAGPNHVLPTGGTARFSSPLGVSDFVKKSSVISYTREALEKVKDDIICFAGAEGLSAHANAIKVRFGEDCRK